MKTNELKGTLLDWAVATAEKFDIIGSKGWVHSKFGGREPYSPSTSWALGGAIIERERISIENVEGLYWTAGLTHRDEEYGGWRRAYEQGDTPLEAAMRCYVASKLGNEVEIPEGV
jgi:hypothetical protein